MYKGMFVFREDIDVIGCLPKISIM
jgi:hypothetical protein